MSNTNLRFARYHHTVDEPLTSVKMIRGQPLNELHKWEHRLWQALAGRRYEEADEIIPRLALIARSV